MIRGLSNRPSGNSDDLGWVSWSCTNTGLLKCDFSSRWRATVGKISTDIAHRAVPRFSCESEMGKAVKKLVVGSRVQARGSPCGDHCPSWLTSRFSLGALNWVLRVAGTFAFKKLECSKQADCLKTGAWNNGIGPRFRFDCWKADHNCKLLINSKVFGATSDDGFSSLRIHCDYQEVWYGECNMDYSGLWVAGFIAVHRPFRCYAATSGQSFTHNMPLYAEQ